MTKSVSVVVPVYNSQEGLVELHRRLTAVLAAWPVYEILLVDDGSADGSWDVIRDLAARDPRVTGLRMGRNFGQHPALLAGIRRASGAVVVTLDDDLQNPPEEIPGLVQRLDAGADVVYGVPRAQRQDLWRNVASRLTKLALRRVMGARESTLVSAFRAFRTELRDSFAAYDSPFVNVDVLLSWGTRRIEGVPVEQHARQRGRSGYNLGRLLMHAANMVTGFSVFPLQVATFLGFGITFFGACTFFYVLIRYLVAGSTVAGFPFLASLIAIMGGAQMFALGVIGEYLARIHFRTMGRPPYVVRSITSSQADDAP